MFFEKAQLLISITKVTLRSLIFNQEPRYQGPSFSFVNETTSIQGPLFGVKHCCSSKSHRQTKIKKRFLRLDSLTKHEVRGSYANPQLCFGFVQLSRILPASRVFLSGYV